MYDVIIFSSKCSTVGWRSIIKHLLLVGRSDQIYKWRQTWSSSSLAGVITAADVDRHHSVAVEQPLGQQYLPIAEWAMAD
jgi:hypothetical protein